MSIADGTKSKRAGIGEREEKRELHTGGADTPLSATRVGANTSYTP